MTLADETPSIPTDEDLAALSDGDLLQLLETHGIDAGPISDRNQAIAALQAKRDAAPAEPAADNAEPAADPAPVETINTIADEPEVEADEEVQPARRRLSDTLAEAVRAAHAANDAGLHAALHNFDIAYGDFKRAAAQVEAALPADTPLGEFVRAVRES